MHSQCSCASVLSRFVCCPDGPETLPVACTADNPDSHRFFSLLITLFVCFALLACLLARYILCTGHGGDEDEDEAEDGEMEHQQASG